jgi:hypothetical protein
MPLAITTRPLRRLASTTALLIAAATFACTGDSEPLAQEPGCLDCGAPAECDSDNDCPAGNHCEESGVCAPIDLLGQPWENECAVLDATFESLPPTVVMLIDQSGSMDAAYGAGTRWSELHDALVDPTDGVIANLEADVHFGMALYTSHDGDAGGTCPIVNEVGVAFDNFTAIADVYGAAQPDQDTPTGEALTVVADKLAALDVEGPRAIILATDGEPDTCSDPNPSTAAGLEAARETSIAAAQHAHGLGIRTYVLAVGNEVGEAHLADMANAGAGLPSDGADQASFYRPDNKAGLVEAFNTIIDGERACLFAIQSTGSVRGEFDPALARFSTITLDGTPLVYGDPDGWRMAGDDHIELTGAACQTIKSGDHELSGSFVCEGPPGAPR